MATKIDKKMLEGLVFSGSKEEKDKKTGKRTWKAFSRPLTVGDIVSSGETFSRIVITTADGKKYTLKKGDGKGASSAGNEDKSGNDASADTGEGAK